MTDASEWPEAIFDDDLTDQEVDMLTDADIAARWARGRWISKATHPKRKGKQLVPYGSWTVLLWRAGRGFGKSQPLVEVVPTPTGFTSIGNLKV